MTEVALYVEHSIVYSNEKPLPVQDVVDSLLAMGRLSERVLPGVLKKLTQATVLEVKLLVDGIEQGSFKESFWLQLIFDNERSLKRFQKAVRELDWAGMYKELPPKGSPVTKAVFLSAVTAALVAYAVSRFTAGEATPEERALIQANNNTIIAIGAEAYQVSPEAFASIIESAVRDRKKDVTQAAAHILAPAHREPDATVKFGEAAVMPSEVVRMMPKDVTGEPHESEEEFEDALVDIRQMNRDSSTSGWRARLDGVFDDRVKLTLGDEVTINDLAGKLEVRARVVVRYRMSERRGGMVPVEITLLELHGAADTVAATPARR
jgi:hypothetical protein